MQRPMQPLLLLGLEQAAVAALGDQQLDLFRRVQVAGGRAIREPNSRRISVADAVQEREKRPEQPRATQRIGSTVASAVSVGYCSASAFGTSSPMTSWIAGEDDEHDDGRGRAARSRGSSSKPARQTSGASGTLMVACAYAPSIRLESVMPICEAPT